MASPWKLSPSSKLPNGLPTILGLINDHNFPDELWTLSSFGGASQNKKGTGIHTPTYHKYTEKGKSQKQIPSVRLRVAKPVRYRVPNVANASVKMRGKNTHPVLAKIKGCTVK